MAETPTGPAGRVADEVVWRPSDEYVRTSRLTRFMDRHGVPDLDTLLRRSTDDLDWFWRAVSDDLELEWYRPFEQASEAMATSGTIGMKMPTRSPLFTPSARSAFASRFVSTHNSQ